MWIKYLKKGSTFAYKRLFFILLISVVLIGVVFTGYVMHKSQLAFENKQASQNFFTTHQPRQLAYKQKRSFYLKEYGKATREYKNDEKQQRVDTYLSQDGSKGITITYQVVNNSDDDAYIIGYIIVGNEMKVTKQQIEDSKGKPLSEIIKVLGSGEIFTEIENTGYFEVVFRSDDAFYVLKGDKTTEIIQEVRIEQIK